ncbi:MAG: type IV pilus twitching motility protein PilT [Actinobacteria bacterium]|nr:MAG: type IV pilus twitching motility protein PilT [Actinomycetota bacterium]
MANITTTLIDSYLQELWDLHGTDLLVTVGAPPLLRVDGAPRPATGSSKLDPDEVEKIVLMVLPEKLHEEYHASHDVDFSFNWEGKARFRANAFMQRGSAGLALRLIPFEIPSFEDLGLPPVIEHFVTIRQGFVLVTGPTGAGKSTTLASMIDYINDHRACHIITIEDPLEYVHRHKKAAVNQREVGQDTVSFPRALRSALRADPDVILVGEMRDLETIQTTLSLAETGHLVFATLHTNDTAQAVDRIVDVFPTDNQNQVRVQLANTLAGIVYQQLLPRIGGGQVAAFEVLVATHPVRNLIRGGKSHQIRNVVATGAQDQMQTLETALSDLVARGIVTYEEAVARSTYPKEVIKPRTGQAVQSVAAS